MVRQVTKSEDTCWRWGWAQNQHQGEDCFLAVEPNDQSCFFFPFLSHRSDVRKDMSLFPPHCHVLQTFSCLPRPSGSSHNFPQRKSREQAQASAQSTHPPPAGFSLLLYSSPVFPSVSLLSTHPSLPQQPILSPAASPPVPSSLPSWLPTQPPWMAGLLPKPNHTTGPQ